jgi:Trypsin-co-occurring domain 1
MPELTIPVIVEAQPDKDIFGEGALARLDLPLQKVSANLAELTGKLSAMAAAAWKAGGDLSLSEIELGIEITAEGGVSLIGTAKAGASASISLTFKRMP